MALRNDIKKAIGTRLRTITNANGYKTNVAQVFDERVPMGLALEDQELPAIFVIAGNDVIGPNQQNVLFNEWTIWLQLIMGDVLDEYVFNFITDVGKAIFANSPMADRQDEFRTLHKAIYNVEIANIEHDLNMIEANRFAIMQFTVRYITKYNTL
jgi:hypothetical protein